MHKSGPPNTTPGGETPAPLSEPPSRKRIVYTVVMSAVARGISISSSFVITPLLIHRLGKAEYGYWVAILSLVGMLSFADFGIGSGLMNSMSGAFGRGDRTQVRRLASNAFFLLGSLACALTILAIMVFFVLPWTRVLKGAPPVVASRYSVVFVIIAVATLLQLPFSTVQRAQYAANRGYIAQVWAAIGTALAISSLGLAIISGRSVRTFALAFAAWPFLVLAGNWANYFLRRNQDLLPKWSDFDLAVVKTMLADGSTFLIIQMGAIFIFSTDSIIILHLFGSQEVTDYNLVGRLFLIPTILASMWFSALWPSYAHALAAGRVDWVRSTLIRSTSIAAAGAIACTLVLGVSVSWCIRLWTGLTVHPNFSLLCAFASTTVLIVTTSSVAMYLNASNYVAQQSKLVVMHVFVSLPLALILPRFIGPEGVAWSTTIGYLAVILPAYVRVIPRLLQQQSAAISVS